MLINKWSLLILIAGEEVQMLMNKDRQIAFTPSSPICGR
jgi:hypothetical protein